MSQPAPASPIPRKTSTSPDRPETPARKRRRSRAPAPDPFLIDLPGEEPAPAGSSPDRPPPLPWKEIFGADRPLRIEIGFGKSEFLIDIALQEPGYNYIGFEYSRKRVENFLRKVHRRGAANIRVIWMNAVGALDRAFAAGSVDRFYILFPDPWPKRRHAKHRFVRKENVERLARLLRPGGGISLRTDAPAYALQMREALEAHPELENLAGAGNFAAAPRDPIATIYQAKFEKAGRKTFFLEFDRRESRG